MQLVKLQLKDLRQDKNYAIYMKSIGWNVKKIDNVYCFIKKVFLLGNVIKIQRANLDTKLIEKLSQYHPFQIIYEPIIQSKISSNFTISKSPYLPTKTLQIDLRQSEKQLLANMHSKTRYNIKVAQKNNLTILESDDISAFASFWSKNREGQGINLFSQKNNIEKLYEAFRRNSSLLFIMKNNEIFSGILMPFSGNIATYMYAASSNKGKRLHAPTLAVWEALKIAKRQKCKIFDFEGIYDERFPIKSWVGFSKFKKTFGGQEITYPGCFIKTNILSFLKK